VCTSWHILPKTLFSLAMQISTHLQKLAPKERPQPAAAPAADAQPSDSAAPAAATGAAAAADGANDTATADAANDTATAAADGATDMDASESAPLLGQQQEQQQQQVIPLGCSAFDCAMLHAEAVPPESHNVST
jgi:hypothetical protein